MSDWKWGELHNSFWKLVLLFESFSYKLVQVSLIKVIGVQKRVHDRKEGLLVGSKQIILLLIRGKRLLIVREF